MTDGKKNQEGSTGTNPSDGQGAQQGSPNASGEGGNPTEDPSMRTGGAPDGSGSGDEGAQGPFTHPDLKDKDPKEVERLYDMMKNTTREQGARLNEMARQQNQSRQQNQGQGSQGSQAPEGAQGEFSADDFWKDPVGTMRGLVKSEMEETVRPLRDRIDSGGSQEGGQGGQVVGEAARAQLREQIPDFQTNEPWIDQLLAQLGIAPEAATLETLRMVNYTARGMRQDQQGQTPQQGQQMNQNQQDQQGRQGQQQNPTQRQQPNPPPQQRPSSAPLPRGQESQGATRDLTENEKRMAREFGFVDDRGNINAEEFIRWQDMTPEEVVTAER